MTDDDKMRTMREFYADEGYDPASLTHPRDVSPDDLDDDSRVIAYTVVRNPDINGPATTWALDEYEVQAVVPVEEAKEYTDGAVWYTDSTTATHAVHWAYRTGDVPKLIAINHEPYDDRDPHGWDRTQRNVLGLSDDFIRFDC